MRQNRQTQPPEHGPNPRSLTPGEIALGMGIFILMYATRAGRLVWNGAFLNKGDFAKQVEKGHPKIKTRE